MQQNPFRVPQPSPTGSQLNPGLELANTFGVKILSPKQEVARLLRRFNLGCGEFPPHKEIYNLRNLRMTVL